MTFKFFQDNFHRRIMNEKNSQIYLIELNFFLKIIYEH